MATAAPRLFVDSPPITPSRFGLLSVAELPTGDAPQWVNGVEYHPNPVPDGFTDSAQCLAGPADPREVPEGLPFGGEDPFIVVAGFRCKSVGLTKDDVHNYAAQKLAVSEGVTVEDYVWSKHTTPFMTPGIPTLSADAVPLVDGVGLLESFLYSRYAGTGVIHLPRQLAVHLDKAGVAHGGSSPRLHTLLGTSLSFGNYPGTGPTGLAAPAGTTWLVATGAVQVRRTEPKVRTTEGASAYFNRTNNEVTGLAERLYVVSWDQVAAAVLVETGEAEPPQAGPGNPSAATYPSSNLYPGGN